MPMPLLPILLLVAVPSGVIVDQDAPTPAPKPPKEKKICRSESATSSRLPVRTCMTKAEWEMLDASRAEGAATTLGRVESGTRR